MGKHLVWFAATFSKTLFAQTSCQTSGFEIPGADFINDHVDEADVDVENVVDVDNVADVDVFQVPLIDLSHGWLSETTRQRLRTLDF